MRRWRVPRGFRPPRSCVRSSGILGARFSYSGGERVTWTAENEDDGRVVARRG